MAEIGSQLSEQGEDFEDSGSYFCICRSSRRAHEPVGRMLNTIVLFASKWIRILHSLVQRRTTALCGVRVEIPGVRNA